MKAGCSRLRKSKSQASMIYTSTEFLRILKFGSLRSLGLWQQCGFPRFWHSFHRDIQKRKSTNLCLCWLKFSARMLRFKTYPLVVLFLHWMKTQIFLAILNSHARAACVAWNLCALQRLNSLRMRTALCKCNLHICYGLRSEPLSIRFLPHALSEKKSYFFSQLESPFVSASAWQGFG